MTTNSTPNKSVFARTTVIIEGVGEVEVVTVDFHEPGYACDGFETVTTLPDGRSFGCGPDNGETPAELHAAMSDPAEVAKGIKDAFGSDAQRLDAADALASKLGKGYVVDLNSNGEFIVRPTQG